MHRSRLAGFIIDTNTDDLAAAGTFWSRALGLADKPSVDGVYVTLDSKPVFDLNIEVQRVAHPSRVHLDLETDDLDAEVARVEALGAKRIERVKHWIVMEAPTGHRFCVVKVDSLAG